MIAVDAFLTDSSRQADVVLPAAGFAEKPGTTTNLEGRVSRLDTRRSPRRARPGADWMIAVELADRLGGDLGLESVEADLGRDRAAGPVPRRASPRARLGSREGLDGIVAGDVRRRGSGHPPDDGADREPGRAAAEATATTSRPRHARRGRRPDRQGDAVPRRPAVSRRPAPAATTTLHEAQTPPVGRGPGEAAEGADPAGATIDRPAATRPARPAVLPLLQCDPAPRPEPPPAIDSYSLRLVVARKLYDAGTLVQQSPSLAPLAPGAPARQPRRPRPPRRRRRRPGRG